MANCTVPARDDLVTLIPNKILGLVFLLNLWILSAFPCLCCIMKCICGVVCVGAMSKLCDANKFNSSPLLSIYNSLSSQRSGKSHQTILYSSYIYI